MLYEYNMQYICTDKSWIVMLYCISPPLGVKCNTTHNDQQQLGKHCVVKSRYLTNTRWCDIIKLENCERKRTALRERNNYYGTYKGKS